MGKPDEGSTPPRWKDRFESFTRMLGHLDQHYGVYASGGVPAAIVAMARSGVIKDFELAFELAWKTMKDCAYDQGTDARTPREAIEAGWTMGLVGDVAGWLKLLKNRNLFVHVYDEEQAEHAISQIGTVCLPLLRDFASRMRDWRQAAAPDGLPVEWRTGIASVLERFPQVSRALVFGSRSTGRFRKDSDLDLAIETTDGKPLEQGTLAEMLLELDELYLPIKIDLIDRVAVSNEKFAAAIARDGRVWWERNGDASAKGHVDG